MKSVPVARLKARLAEYLRAVKAGESFLVTNRGRPAATLTPPPRTPDLSGDMKRLVEAGLVRVGTGKLPKDFWDRPRAPDPDGRALAALLEERREGM